MNQLTVLSFGAGQDSTFILYKIVLEKWFRTKYVPGRFIVVMSDTGNEHDHTYEHVKFIEGFCIKQDIEFYFLTNGEYHPRTWPTLQYQMKLNNTIMSMMGPRSCTDNLKVTPIYNFLDHFIGREYYGYIGDPPKGKKFLTKFAEDNGKINVLIGIAHGEESRIKKASKKELKRSQVDAFKKWKDPVPVWFRKCIQKVYPLVIESIARWDIHEQTLQMALPLPFPSNCKWCPYLSKIEILWMYRFIPEDWNEWVLAEKAKIKKCENNGKPNLGVKGEKMLEEILQEAIEEFGHMTNDELNEYKMSHGHCVMSKY